MSLRKTSINPWFELRYEGTLIIVIDLYIDIINAVMTYAIYGGYFIYWNSVPQDYLMK